jgi:hypothetical protein
VIPAAHNLIHFRVVSFDFARGNAAQPEADMTQSDDDYLKQAAECWAEGQPLVAGKLIYENLPPKSRPRWASRILKVVLDRSGIQSSLFDQVLVVADHEDLWKSGHQVFSTLRHATLRLDELERGAGLSEDEERLSSVLSLAELVAKVIYNATNPPDEFDEDSGWWIAACLRGFVDHDWSDEQFTAIAWSALRSRE